LIHRKEERGVLFQQYCGDYGKDILSGQRKKKHLIQDPSAKQLARRFT
jgi:hypothetical protein